MLSSSIAVRLNSTTATRSLSFAYCVSLRLKQVCSVGLSRVPHYFRGTVSGWLVSGHSVQLADTSARVDLLGECLRFTWVVPIRRF